MTTKQTNQAGEQTNQAGEQTLLLAGIPLEKAEAAREALAAIGITFTPKLRTQHHSTREQLEAIFQAYDLEETIATLNDYLAFASYSPLISDEQNNYDLNATTNLIQFLDTSVDWCGPEYPRDAIAFIQEENWKTFTQENPEITTEW